MDKGSMVKDSTDNDSADKGNADKGSADKRKMDKGSMEVMQCQQKDCQGQILDGRCQVCGTTAPSAAMPDKQVAVANQQLVTKSMRVLLQSKDQLKELTASKEELLAVSSSLEDIVADDYSAWRAQTDLLLTAIRQLETRQIEPDESVKILGIPLRESALRDTAEEALRNCAHFADTAEERTALIDEANRIRNTTWF
jgi:Protein kinase G tetratricopeptide repeat